MEPNKSDIGTVAGIHTYGWRSPENRARGVYRRGLSLLVGFALLGTLLIGGGIASPSALWAQGPSLAARRLTVRPHEMATGTHNAQAGNRELLALDGAVVYVPAQCVGTKRVPLVVVVHGGGSTGQAMVDRQRQFADKYGMIILAPTAKEQHWMMTPENVAIVDSAMKVVLREYAIDPDKIALTGMSEGGAMSLLLGRANLDVFSRIAPESPAGYFEGGGPQNTTTQFFFVNAIGEDEGMWDANFDAVRQERQAGRFTEFALVMRPHEQRSEDEALIWSWLQKSWATPHVAVMTAPMADTTLVLTTDMFDKLLNFWNNFMDEAPSIRDAQHKRRMFYNVPEEQVRQYGLPSRVMLFRVPPWPDSVSKTGRRANQKLVTMLIGQEHVVVPMMDIAALAAQNATVATDLKQAGLTALTAQEAEAYRIALLSALATSKTTDHKAGAVVAGSALEKNIKFVNGNKPEMDALDEMGIWDIP